MINETLQRELRIKYNPDGSEIRKAQLRMLEMLKALDTICREHNLVYWLAGGTMLGAARHGGFIPWDDDVDVYMPRKDARKLKKIFGKEILYGFLVLQNTNTDPNYLNSSWMTLRDTKSEYISDALWHNRQKYRGFQVDIFIVDEGVNLWIKDKITWLHQQLIFRPWVGKKMKYLRWAVNFNHRVFDYVIFPLLRLIKFNEKITVGYGCIFSNPQDKATIFPLKEIEFEGYSFYCPNDVERFLTLSYGDWRQLPSEDKRRSDHNFSFKFL